MDQLSQHSTHMADLKKHYMFRFIDIFSDADADDVHQEAVIESFLIALEEWLEHHVNCCKTIPAHARASSFVIDLSHQTSSDANSLKRIIVPSCFVQNYRTASDGESVLHIHQKQNATYW